MILNQVKFNLTSYLYNIVYNFKIITAENEDRIFDLFDKLKCLIT